MNRSTETILLAIIPSDEAHLSMIMPSPSTGVFDLCAGFRGV